LPSFRGQIHERGEVKVSESVNATAGPTCYQAIVPSGAFEQIQRAAELIIEPGSVYELRIPKAGREKTISGYFDDSLKLAHCAAELDATGKPLI
jgi:hypothetical protein